MRTQKLAWAQPTET